MNATMVASGTKAIPPVVSSIQDIPLAKIRESKTNPRRVFDDTKLAELAGNIRQHGVLQPILVRPLPDGEAGTYALVAGARRFRASKLAKRESIPATVRELTDAQALELQVVLQSGTESRRTAEPGCEDERAGPCASHQRTGNDGLCSCLSPDYAGEAHGGEELFLRTPRQIRSQLKSVTHLVLGVIRRPRTARTCASIR